MTNNFFDIFFAEEMMTFDKAAVVLAMTPSRESETALRQHLTDMGFLCAITEVSGKADDVRKKIFHNIVGAALNLSVVEKEPHFIHALVHASHEACLSINFDTWLNSNYLLKIAIVRKNHWLAIAFYGLVATHSVSNHNKLGLGTTHI